MQEASRDGDPGESGPAAAGGPRFAPWAGRAGAAVALVVLVSLVRLAYLAWLCPYTLIEDEAYYWQWSRRLDWSYYSKGPGIAWSIAASTGLLGDTEFGVRAPAVVFAAVAALALAALGTRMSGDRRVGFFAAALTMLVPLYSISGWLMTIDMPYLACWAAACVGAWGALERRSRWGWLGFGAAVAAGFLFKYTILLLLPGVAAYALLRRGRLDTAARPWAWALGGAAVALLGLVPVVVWNAQRGWPTLRHLLGHLGLPGGDLPPEQTNQGVWVYEPLWTLELVGTQIVLIGPVLLLIIAGVRLAMVERREGGSRWPAKLFLMLCAVPILVFYLGVSFVTDVEGNWPAGAYLTLIVLGAWTMVEGMDKYRGLVARWRALPRPRPRWGVLVRRPETFRQVAWHVTLTYGLVVGVVALRLDLLEASPPLAGLNGLLVERGLKEPGSLIPFGRLMGAQEVAHGAAALAAALRDRTGQEPFYVSQQYGRASILAFYLPGRPTVYCANSFQDGRRSDYDYWADTDLTDLERLGGRPAVLFGGKLADWTPAFERVEELGVLPGETKAGRLAFLGYGYRGFPGRVAP